MTARSAATADYSEEKTGLCRFCADAHNLRAELERERKLTARHHRMLRLTRRTCYECWTNDHELGGLIPQ